MTVKDLVIELNMICALLSEKEYIIEYNQYSIKQLGENHFKITWNGRNPEANITFTKGLTTQEIVNRLLDEEQYSILFYDKSIIQVEYILNNDEIIKQRIQYIKKSNIVRSIAEVKELERRVKNVENIQECNHAEEKVEFIEVESEDWFEEENGIGVLIRLDYDPREHKDVVHAKSHLSISNLKECRIPIKSNLSLSQFIEFVLHQVYNEYSIDIEKSIIHDEEITSNEKKVLHINY